MTAPDLAKRLYERAVAVGLATNYQWETLTEAAKRQWLVLAETVGPNPADGTEAATRLLAVERLLQITIRKLDELATTQRSLLLIGESMTAEMQALKDEVTQWVKFNQSAIALLSKVGQLIADGAEDKAAMVELAVIVKKEVAALNEAIAGHPQPPQP